MTDTQKPPREPGAALLAAGRFFRPGTPTADLHGVTLTGGRQADAFTAGDTGPVRATLEKPAAMRAHMRALNLGGEPPAAIAAGVGMAPEEIEAMYRLPAIAKYEERYVIPIAAVGDARRLEESALPEERSLDHAGGPGMGGDGPFGRDSDRRSLPLVSVENFHLLRGRQTSDDAKEA